MKRLVTTMAVLALLAPGSARADCVPVPLADEIAQSDLIFVGRLTSATGNRARFRVEQIYKGNVGRSLDVAMNPMRFYVDASSVGQRFVIFMRRVPPNHFTVNGCGSSQTGREVPRIVHALRAAGLRPRPPGPLRPPG